MVRFGRIPLGPFGTRPNGGRPLRRPPRLLGSSWRTKLLIRCGFLNKINEPPYRSNVDTGQSYPDGKRMYTCYCSTKTTTQIEDSSNHRPKTMSTGVIRHIRIPGKKRKSPLSYIPIGVQRRAKHVSNRCTIKHRRKMLPPDGALRPYLLLHYPNGSLPRTQLLEVGE